MKLSPHINFGGRCEAAFRFYEQIGLGKISTLLTWENSPMSNEIPMEWRQKICHATLNVGNSELAGVDDPFEPYQPQRNIQMLLDIDNAEEAERVFGSLSGQGVVSIPLRKTFWTARYGIVVDQFGIRWEISFREGDPGDQERIAIGF